MRFSKFVTLGRFRKPGVWLSSAAASVAAVAALSGCATVSDAVSSAVGGAVEDAAKPLTVRGVSEITRGVGELVLLNVRSAELGGGTASVERVRKAAALVVGDTANVPALDPDTVVSARDIRSGSRITVVAFGSKCTIDVVYLNGDYSSSAPQCA